MSAISRLAATTALVCTCALPLHAQSDTPVTEVPVTWWNTFTLDNVLTLLAQSFMPTLRVVADIRYSQIDVDTARNQVTFEGLDIRPLVPFADDDSCAVTADSLTLSGAPVDRQTGYILNLALDGAVLDFDCLPPDARPAFGMAGIENLRMDRVQMRADYDFASGGADVSLIADIDDLLTVTASADLDYISYRMDFETEEVHPAVYVNGLKLTLEDRGAYQIGSKFAPPDMLAPEAVGQLVQGGLSEAFAEMNGPEAPALSAEQTAFVTEAAQVLSAFVADPSPIVVEARANEAPIRLAEEDFDDPKTLFAKLAPSFGSAPQAISAGISAAELKQAIDGLLPTARNLDVGRALITGTGAPRNKTLGLRLLDPLAKEGNADATYLMAEAMADSDPATAYRLAVHAASKGIAGALSLMGDLEAQIPLAQVLETQDALVGGPIASDYDTIGQIRRAARSHLRGTTRVRSYRAAYYWASVGAAAGDAASAAIRDEIDTLMRLRGAADPWAEVRTSLENGVLRDWVGRDLPKALQ